MLQEIRSRLSSHLSFILFLSKLSQVKPNSSPFKWRHYEPEIILLCVRWYLRYQLSYRDLEETMRERVLSGAYRDEPALPQPSAGFFTACLSFSAHGCRHS